jgi:TetR/AcrR family transcriptional regulator, regulator of autoinduction and epiphytic fitness
MSPPEYESLGHYRESVSAAKRLAIVAAAQQVFLAVGYTKASITGIAREAGASVATLYKHFASKADLFGEVMASVWDEDTALPRRIAPDTPPKEGLLGIGREYVALLSRPMMRPLFRTIVAESLRAPELGVQLYERAKKPYLERITAYLQACVKRGTLKVEDASLATRQFLGMINDVVFWPTLLIPDLGLSAKESDRVVEQAVATFMARYGS